MTGALSMAVATVRPADYENSVFINCPFDDEYRKSFEAIVLAVICCGLEPRSAAITNVADTRIERIAEMLADCRFSIHDLSRLGTDSRTGVARMNMPLELGIAMALHRMSKRQQAMPTHEWTAMVRTNSAYKQALSDVNGNDLQRYNGDEELVAQVMNWLCDRREDLDLAADPKSVTEQLEAFDTELEGLRAKWVQKLPWSKLVAAGKDVARRANLLPSV